MTRGELEQAVVLEVRALIAIGRLRAAAATARDVVVKTLADAAQNNGAGSVTQSDRQTRRGIDPGAMRLSQREARERGLGQIESDRAARLPLTTSK